LHVDVGSTLAFCTLVSAFVPIKFLDFRPASIRLTGLATQPGNLMALPFDDRSVESISCMHVIEHVGLGRYGDPLDPDGHVRAMRELERVVRPGGSLLLVTPVGRPRVSFNAHRVFAYEQILESLVELRLKSFSLIPDDPTTGLIDYADPALVCQQDYGCGCFWFVRPN